MIHINKMNFSYPDGNQALKNISLIIEAGSTLGVVGANGAGKSTLLALLAGIFLTAEGEIEIAGISVQKSKLEEIRKKVGFVFQNPDDQLFMARVNDDIAFGPKNFGYCANEVKQMVDSAVETMKIGHLLNRSPHKLSGGEKRSVAIATVLAMDPEILLLDEPSSYLDPKSRRNLINAMTALSHTKIIATHDLDMVLDLCDRVIVLLDGTILADGEPSKIFADARLMEKAGLEVPLGLHKMGRIDRGDK